MESITRLLQAPESQSFFLLGPRGTGKSTLTETLYPEATHIDLLLPDVTRSYLNQPERLQKLADALPQGATVVIDEIQKVPTLLDVVHHVIESKRNIRFVLTGSSSRKLKKTGADLLAGRALRCVLHPFIAAELGKRFSLDQALQQGLLPLIINSENPTASLQAYIHLYLREEIQMEGLVRNLDGFSRFLEVMSFSHASLLNLTNIARECDVKRKTVENYLSILEDLLLGYRLNVFTKKAQRLLIAHPKFYFFDTGVYQALRPRGPLDQPSEISGHALEGLVAQHLKAWNDYSSPAHTISYWRTKSGVEVDFIIYGEKYFYAIEVKNATKIHPADLKPLQAFLEDYPMAKAIFLYRGEEYLREKNILCVPCEAFLRQLKPNQDLVH